MSDCLRRIDNYADPVTDQETASAFGGGLTLTGHALVLLYLVYSLIRIFTSDDLTAVNQVLPFPGDGEAPFILPRMMCIAQGGCWVRQMRVAGARRVAPKCYYFAQGEYLSEAARTIFYKADPVDHLSVIWDSCPGGNTKTNFGLSYDFTTLKNMYSGTTQTTTATGAGVLGGYKIYRGSSLMSLSRTVGWSSEPYQIDTFSGVVASTDGTPDSVQNMCCAQPTAVNSAGATVSNPLNSQCAATLNCPTVQQTKYYQVRIAVMPTYSETTIQNPWLTVLEKTGGIAAMIELFFVVLVLAYHKVCKYCCNREPEQVPRKEDTLAPSPSHKEECPTVGPVGPQDIELQTLESQIAQQQ